jgi:hypothetical protein
MSGVDEPEDSSFFHSVNAKEPNQIYKIPISIWYNEESLDHWSRVRFIRYRGLFRIIHTDFSGLLLLDEKLQVIFSMPRSPEMIAENSVYGFHFDGENIMIWKVPEDEYTRHDRNHDYYTDISWVSEVMTIMSPF